MARVVRPVQIYRNGLRIIERAKSKVDEEYSWTGVKLPAESNSRCAVPLFAVYDALIVAAAQDAGCRLLLSEDLQHGLKVGTLTVENPFRREAG
jgi:predicted nucleic acid-binding protein